MSNKVIRVERLSKQYQIGARVERYATLRDRLAETLSSPFRRNGNYPKSNDTIWALKDVSFDVERGEVVGIIGRNGAGKSTLLKILSRITEPTEGRAHIRGRVGSLLEVGTGFHQELTGRENIYLNGAILGMKRTEIERKFDEIVAFAEIDKFIDTPVKRYSSGMYVRLAFAVAAHLEPEILLVDEVLAVGDAQFQTKCLGKMGNVAREGRTILFVSHNMGAIRTLCKRAVLLRGGQILMDDLAALVVAEHLNADVSHTASWQRNTPVPLDAEICFLSAQITDESGNVTGTVDPTQPFVLKLVALANRDTEKSQIAVRFTNQEGIPVFTTANTDSWGRFVTITKGEHEYEIAIPANLLIPGLYTLQIASSIPGVKLHDIVDNELAVVLADMWNHSTKLRDDRLGVVGPCLEWIEKC